MTQTQEHPVTSKMIELVDVPPFRKRQVHIGAGYLQVSVGHYPDDTGCRSETFARRVYVDQGALAIIRLMEDLADFGSDNMTLPVWDRNDQIAGYRGGEKP